MKKQAKLFCVFLLTAVLFIVSVEPVKAYAVWQDADAACPAYSFTGLSNSAVTHQTAAGKTAVLVFFRNTCPNSQSTVSALAQADWAANSGLAILAVNLEGASAAEVQSFAETYGDGGENIIFCTDPSAQVWSLLRAAGYSASSVTLPVTFVVDSSGRIRHYATGAVNEIAFESVLCSYVDGIETIPVHDVSVTGTFDYDEACAVLEEINRQRAANQLPPLAMCGDLMEAAMQRAAECSLTYSHTRPNGGDCFSILPGIACGENIAVGFTSAAEVMEGWMNSPGHRSNILYDGYTTVGVGCFYQDSARYWTQTFGVDTPPQNALPPAENRREVLQRRSWSPIWSCACRSVRLRWKRERASRWRFSRRISCIILTANSLVQSWMRPA